ncbi:MAG: adenylyl-sulfate kinase [Anaerohalosphaeraceae bacterium]
MNKTLKTDKKQAFVLWLTGLSGAGKSTLADRVYDQLAKSGRRLERLDGDSLRAAFPSTGFSRKDRDEHIKRVGYLASRLEHHGVIVVASFISPYREARDFVRQLCHNFVEVYVDASLETCQQRDVKGLYKKAMAGQIQSFTGLDDPYEEPEHPEIIVKTDQQSIEQSEKTILDYIQRYL